MVITSFNNYTRIYYLFQQKKPFELYGTSSVCSNNSNKCLTLSKDSIRIYDLDRQSLIKVIKGNTIFKSAAFSPDDKFIATTGIDSLCVIYECSTGNVFQTLKGHTKKINSVSYSRDNKYVLSSSDDNTAKIYDIVSGEELITVKNKSNWINSVMYSPNCKSISMVNENRVTIYDVSTGKEIYCLKDRTGQIESLFLNSNDGIGAIGSYSESSMGQKETSCLFELSTCKPICFSTGKLYTISSNGEFFLNSNSDDKVEICSVDNSKRISLKGNYGKINSAEFSSDNKFVLTASNDKKVRLYDFLSGELIKVFSTHKKKIYSALFSRNNKYVVTASKDKTARVYDVYSGDEIQVLNGHASWVIYANFNNSGDMVLTVTRDNTINVFNVSDGLKLYSFEGYSGTFSPDGSNLITIDKDSSVHVYNMLDGKLVHKIGRHTDRINDVTCSADGRFVSSASRDGTICIQNITNMESHKILIRHTNEVKSSIFSTDGNFIFSFDRDNRSVLWSTKTWGAVYERIQLENNNWLVKLPNSPYYMCSKGASKMLHYVTPSLKVIGFDQLDPVYNRPDIVLDSIGKYFGGADQELVTRYREAWEKRIDRLGLDKEKLGKGESLCSQCRICGC